MSEYTKEQLAEINKLATDFTRNILDDFPPNHMCFTVSYPLSLYLENLGYENRIVAGNYQNEKSPKNGLAHFWIQLGDDLQTIIDPTIGQFNENEFRVFIGQKPIEFKESPQDFKEWFYGNFGTYEKWKDKLLGEENPLYYPEQSNRDSLELGILLNINLHAATILNSQTISNNQVQTDIYEKYFDCIFKIIRNYYGKKEWSQIIYKEGFNDLFAKALVK